MSPRLRDSFLHLLRLKLALYVLLVFAPVAAAQHEEHAPAAPVKTGESDPPPEHAASGTSLEPRSVPHAMWHYAAGPWGLLFHGNASLVATQQSGPQGRDKLFGVNWVMLSLDRRVGPGAFTLRSMLSLEPAAITQRRYPLLFQTGETAFGAPLINAQHPHDLFMELAARYSLPLRGQTKLVLYGGPVGDPALGPVAFPHRTSAAELPAAPLGHHLQDSTHIAASVFTVGLGDHRWRLEASAFHGREPNEERWDLDGGAPDSWSARFTLMPGPNWVVQVSHGHLNEPEELEAGDIDRTTASLSYNRRLAGGNWATTLVWGRNHERPSGANLNGYLLETSLQFRERNYLFSRIENVDREGLFLTGNLEAEPLTRVAAFTVGAARDLLVPRDYQVALGFDMSFHRVPGVLRQLYGSHPGGARLFLRLRLGSASSHHQH